jgi:hypothetical protein
VGSTEKTSELVNEVPSIVTELAWVEGTLIGKTQEIMAGPIAATSDAISEPPIVGHKHSIW